MVVEIIRSHELGREEGGKKNYRIKSHRTHQRQRGTFRSIRYFNTFNVIFIYVFYVCCIIFKSNIIIKKKCLRC